MPFPHTQAAPFVRLSPEVAAALAANRPVVALESTIISHGMPFPQNLATAREVEAQVRRAGAVPATVAVLAGQPCVGAYIRRARSRARFRRAAAPARPLTLNNSWRGGKQVWTTRRWSSWRAWGPRPSRPRAGCAPTLLLARCAALMPRPRLALA
jgi:hypothetical protein